MQNMLGRTPLVEKTVAAQRDDVQQQGHAASQFALQRQHKSENVQLKRESPRTEVKKDNPRRGQTEDQERAAAPATEAQDVEVVAEAVEEIQHRLDVTV
jgi:hypothetical protein